MKIALLQINPVVGDISGNADKIFDSVVKANQQKPDLIVTSELALIGYPPRDLLLMKGFISRSWEILENLAKKLIGYPPVIIGIAEINPDPIGRPLFNSAVLLSNGKIDKIFRKTLLPTYDVFDEDRYFEPAKDSQILHFKGKKIGISICEDIWNDRDFWNKQRYETDPIINLKDEGAEVILNISASPFTVGKQILRENMLASVAKKTGLPIIYVNQVGGNDDLVFDGRSCAFSGDGEIIVRGQAFKEDIIIVNMDNYFLNIVNEDDFLPESEVWNALVLGTSDYLRKTGFSKALLGLSGGIDSALTAAIAVAALGPDNVIGVMMPSPYSSPGSIDDSLLLAKNLGIKTVQIPISSIMDRYDSILKPVFKDLPRDITEENLQARIRSTLLMAISNKTRAILLTTGNKSELSVGYCTIYGDMSGGLAVISDLPKIMVYRIAKWLNHNRKSSIIPESIIQKVPSAELRPNQTDQDSLPPYDILDTILLQHIEEFKLADEIDYSNIDAEIVKKVLHLVKIAEFKRKQSAPGLKVTDRAFGTGWRMPIASKEL